MGACVPYRVRVLKLVEDVVEVSAVHAGEAVEEAKKLPDVARVITAWPKHWDDDDE